MRVLRLHIDTSKPGAAPVFIPVDRISSVNSVPPSRAGGSVRSLVSGPGLESMVVSELPEDIVRAAWPSSAAPCGEQLVISEAPCAPIPAKCPQCGAGLSGRSDRVDAPAVMDCCFCGADLGRRMVSRLLAAAGAEGGRAGA